MPKKQATADGKLSWETMECLGACEQAPALSGQRSLLNRHGDARGDFES